MIVSARRLTIRSVQPPKYEIEPGGHHYAAQDIAAELVGAEPVGKRRRFERHRRLARQRIVRRDIGSDQRAQRDQHEQREGKSGDRILRHHIARVPQHRIGRRLRRDRSGGDNLADDGGALIHPSSLTRGSMTL
jgi:hypothetical protein